MQLEKRKITILNKVSTILTPGRTTLLLGPPGGGKVRSRCAAATAADLLASLPSQAAVPGCMKLVTVVDCFSMCVCG